MASNASHRQLLRELVRSGRNRPRNTRAPIIAKMRDFVSSEKLSRADLENTALFLRSQRVYKALLDRYNPLHDMNSADHLKATARRVGLNMPRQKEDSDSE